MRTKAAPGSLVEAAAQRAVGTFRASQGSLDQGPSFTLWVRH